nr:hypothetical protein [Myxococcota bacterium]
MDRARNESWCLLVIPLVLGSCTTGGSRRVPPPLSCTPYCEDRTCGEDGCGGTCGTCEEGTFCEPFLGRCFEGSGGVLTGSLGLMQRPGHLLPGGGVELEDARWIGALGAILVVASADGEVLGAGEVNSRDGDFRVTTSRALRPGDRLVVTTWWAPKGTVVLAVLRPPEGEFHESTPLSPWSWVVETGGRADLGTLTVTEAEGSGALYLFVLARQVQQSVLDSVLSGDALPLVRLGVVWGPGTVFGCGACFASTLGFQIEGGPRMLQSVLIDDDPTMGGPWSWPVLLHEMGHYVAENYSRDDSPGGSHFLGQKLPPAFAWSEGWASFFGAMIASEWSGEPQPYYWDIQPGGSFWIDYDAGRVDDRSDVRPPVPAQGQNQVLDETWVTHFLWHLREGDGGAATRGGLYDDPGILWTFGSK